MDKKKDNRRDKLDTIYKIVIIVLAVIEITRFVLDYLIR
jgi:hypothetical protein